MKRSNSSLVNPVPLFETTMSGNPWVAKTCLSSSIVAVALVLGAGYTSIHLLVWPHGFPTICTGCVSSVRLLSHNKAPGLSGHLWPQLCWTFLRTCCNTGSKPVHSAILSANTDMASNRCIRSGVSSGVVTLDTVSGTGSLLSPSALPWLWPSL